MATGSQALGGQGAKARPRTRVTGRAAALFVVSALLIVALVYPGRLYLEQRGRIQELERQTQQLTQDNAELTARVTKLRDPAYLESLARRCLGMVRPGETAFVLVPRGATPEPVSC